ncbi:MAG: hypothetical protein IJS99_06540 [Synergistaceae bacterium]|nr:hypothetical protein [Synergistaceae bacterium]
MKTKFFVIILIILVSVNSALSSQAIINPDKDIHSVIGGLYAMALAVNLNNNINPDINKLQRYFVSVPANAQISRVNDSIWVGVKLAKTSTARHYLRSHSPELNITDSPEGYSWMGGDFAWLKAADISGKKLIPMKLKISRGTGKDSQIIFISTDEQNTWWQANPALTQQAANSALTKWAAKNSPELHAPEGVAVSIYESVKPSPVARPGKMHVGSDNGNDKSMAVGDVMINPIPSMSDSSNYNY